MGNDASSPVGGKTHKHERFAMKKWLISFLLREHKKKGKCDGGQGSQKSSSGSGAHW